MSHAQSPLHTPLLMGCALALAAAGLCACGAEGGLQRPAPLFGDNAKRQYQADRAAGRSSGSPDIDAAAPRGVRTPTANNGNNDDNAPRTTRDIQDPDQKLTPLSASPIDGPPNPLGSPVSTRPPG